MAATLKRLAFALLLVAVLLSALATLARGEDDDHDHDHDHGASKGCNTTFAGKTVKFQKCNKEVVEGSDDFRVYWSVIENGSLVETLIEKDNTTANEYISWGWNTSATGMVPSRVAVAYVNGSTAQVAPYFLSAKNAAGVNRNDTVPFDKEHLAPGAERDGSTLRARFVVSIDGEGEVPTIWAYGAVEDPATGRLKYHGAANSGPRTRGGAKYNLTKVDDEDHTGHDHGDDDKTPSPSPSASPEPCIAVQHLAHLAANDLVFRAHHRDDAAVLCDPHGSCATAAHIVVLNGNPMSMRAYCEKVQCTHTRMAVNSPRMKRALRIASATSGLEFTALAARYGYRFEEAALRALVRMGL